MTTSDQIAELTAWADEAANSGADTVARALREAADKLSIDAVERVREDWGIDLINGGRAD